MPPGFFMKGNNMERPKINAEMSKNEILVAAAQQQAVDTWADLHGLERAAYGTQERVRGGH